MDPRRRPHDPSRDHERQHGSEDRRMKEEIRSGRGADHQRDEDAPGPAALVTGQPPIDRVGGQDHQGAGGGGREDALHVQLANGTALQSHRQRPDGQKNRKRAGTGPATVRKPDRREAEVGQQRDAQGERRPRRPDDATLLLARDSRRDIDAECEGDHRRQDRHDAGRGVARDPHPQKRDVARHERREDLSQSKKADRVYRARRKGEGVEKPVTDSDVADLAFDTSRICCDSAHKFDSSLQLGNVVRVHLFDFGSATSFARYRSSGSDSGYGRSQCLLSDR